MKCKKILLISSMLGAMGFAGLANAATLTDSVTVNFTGLFQDTTCKIDLNNSAVAGNGTIDVSLGIYKTTVMSESNDTTTAIPFSISFSDCGAISNASIAFVGTQTESSLFDVSGDNKSLVGIGINTTSTPGSYLTTSDSVPVSVTDGAGNATFYARYVKIGDVPVVEGPANAVTTMEITYS